MSGEGSSLTASCISCVHGACLINPMAWYVGLSVGVRWILMRASCVMLIEKLLLLLLSQAIGHRNKCNQGRGESAGKRRVHVH